MASRCHTSLTAAVAHMTEVARLAGREAFVMTPGEWRRLVISYMVAGRAVEFGIAIVNRTGDAESIDEINRWLCLAMDIWNAMPAKLRPIFYSQKPF